MKCTVARMMSLQAPLASSATTFRAPGTDFRQSSHLRETMVKQSRLKYQRMSERKKSKDRNHILVTMYHRMQNAVSKSLGYQVLPEDV